MVRRGVKGEVCRRENISTWLESASTQASDEHKNGLYSRWHRAIPRSVTHRRGQDAGAGSSPQIPCIGTKIDTVKVDITIHYPKALAHPMCHHAQ